MICRKIFIQWIILYLLLATPGSQIVLCWGEGGNHFVLEAVSNSCGSDHPHENAPSSQPSVNFTFQHPNCDVASCIDIPLSINSHFDPVILSSPFAAKYLSAPAILSPVCFPNYRGLDSIPGLRVSVGVAYPIVPLVSLCSVRLLN